MKKNNVNFRENKQKLLKIIKICGIISREIFIINLHNLTNKRINK